MKKKRIILIFILLLILAIIISVGTILFINYSNTKNEDNVEKNSWILGEKIELTKELKKELYRMVKKEITNKLKTPSTAEFPSISDWDIYINSNNVIVVSSYVDSQNSYGAMLRSDFEHQYIISGKGNYICTYKEFDNETIFKITERSQFDEVLNKKLSKEDVDEVLKGSSIIYNKMSYEFDEKAQILTLNITEEEKGSYNIRTGVYSCIITEINQCFCMPTITMNIIVNNEKNKKLAEVKNIDFDFLINEWNSLSTVGISYSPGIKEVEEELGDRLWQDNKIKKIDLDYIDTSVFNQ